MLPWFLLSQLQESLHWEGWSSSGHSQSVFRMHLALLRAGCKGREAGRKIAQGISDLFGYTQACAEERGDGMKQSWSFQSDEEPL